MKKIFLSTLLSITLWFAPAWANKPVLRISGVDGALHENLLASLALAAETCASPDWRIRQLFMRSPESLKLAARALGFYHITIDKQLSFDNQCWQAHFAIEAGEPLLLDSVNILFQGEAQQDQTFKEILTTTPVSVGHQLHHGEYDDLKLQIETVAAEKGYFDGRFTQAILEIDPENNKAHVKLEYDSGKRYRIGRLELQQQVYDDKLIERFITINSGDHYDAAALSKSHQNLTDSGYFEQVSIKQDFKNARNGNIDIRVQLEPRKKTAYSIGLGAATDTGPRLKANLEKRRVNRRGHRFNSELLLSGLESSIGLEYTIPTYSTHINQVSVRGSYQEIDTGTSNSDITKIGVRTLGSRAKWSEILYIDWVSETSRNNGRAVSADLLVPGVHWSRTVADNRLNPRNGYRANIELRGAEKTLLSDASFLQLLAEGKWIKPLVNARLLLRIQTGFSLTDDFNEIPASYRFYAGGDQSVRGYEYQSLGPLSVYGDTDGGKYLLTGSIEYDHQITDNWSAALFWDAGNAFNESNVEFKQSVGLGVRWHSPVGPIRVDFAVPDDTSKDDFRLHFSMGADL